MIIRRLAVLSTLTSLGILAGYSGPAKADVTVLRCVGPGPLLKAAIDLESGIFYLRHPYVRSWYIETAGNTVLIPGMGRLTLDEGILEWGRNIYRCNMSPN
jgi:hypothetical protein